MKLLLSAALLLLPRLSQACAICFGAVDTQKGFFDGLGYAILTLVFTTMAIIAAIGYAFYSVERERARAEKRA
jgi:hypothetical protein